MTAVVLRGDARALPLSDASVDLVVTSPPYFGLRSYTDNVKCYECIQMEYNGRDPQQAWPDYAVHVREVHQRHYDGQIGSEATPAEWLAAMTECVAEMARVLKPSGSIFLNVGDRYATTILAGNPLRMPNKATDPAHRGPLERIARGSTAGNIPNKSLMGLPWRLALACTDQLGLILRRDIIWSKPNGLPESVTDRCRSGHEYVFHLVKSPRYYAAVDEIRTPASGYARPNGAVRVTPGGQRPRMMADAVNPLGALPGSVWTIPSQPLTVPAHLGTDHFAAYPCELPRRCILGWSPRAVCDNCGFLLGSSYDYGMPGVRQSHNGRSRQRRIRTSAGTESEPLLHKEMLDAMDGQEQGEHDLPPTDDSRLRGDPEAGPSDGAEERLHDGTQVHHGGASWTATGTQRGRASSQWRQDRQPDRESGVAGQDRARPDAQASTAAVRLPSLRGSHSDVRHVQSCPHCGSDRLRPSVILDGFGGTGTTALVASVLGRNAISIDRSADYCRLARWRCTDPAERARAMQVPKPPPVPAGQVSLFDMTGEAL